MSVVFALVAQGPDVLCEAGFDGGEDKAETCHTILEKSYKATSDSTKHTYVERGSTYNIKGVGPLIFMCVSDESFGRRLPFVLLNDISHTFFAKFPELEDPNNKIDVHDENATSRFRGFAKVLRSKMDKYSNSPEFDKIKQIRQGLDEVKEVMIENIEKVIQRGEDIDVLVNKTDDLHLTSDSFKKSSRKLRQSMCWANFKMKAVTTLGFMIVLYVLMAMFCGADLSQCV
mmetsp:Transcript_26683/g.52578  ORF Transcript_26683/g.52578 Transcript_26683/m.52578 type:complete len:230 (+) Transcript_26683:46-735(+)